MPKKEKNWLQLIVGGGGSSSSDRGNRRSSGGGSHPQREPKESNWREKSCPGFDGYCGTTIKYRTDWENIPSYCPACTAKYKKANRPIKEPRQPKPDMWREFECPGAPGYGCGNPVRYRTDWSHIPTHCEVCSKREFEKKCATPGCDNSIKFKLHYTNVRNVCGHCQKMMELGASRQSCIDCGGLLWVPPGKNYKRCKNCSERNKRTKPCKNPLCSNVIEYYHNDEKQYDYCRTCTGWQEKHCAVATCNTPIRYKGMWTNVPSFCEEHLREMQERQHPRNDEHSSKDYPSIHATLPGTNSSAADMGGDKAVILGFPDGHKHVSVFCGRKKEPGNWRYSWNVDSSGRYVVGSAHYSDDASGAVRGPDFSDAKRWFNG